MMPNVLHPAVADSGSEWTQQAVEYLVHDLKTPLASIATCLHLLEGHVSGDRGTQILSECQSAAERLQRMIHNLLDLGRIQAGELLLAKIPVRLDDLVDEALAAVAIPARGRVITLTVELGPLGEQVVLVDFELMTRVLVNLLENAIRHSPSGSRVTVTGQAEGDRKNRLIIQDSGPGIPDDQRERIFERFAQAPQKAGARPAGSGLGLAFCRSVAAAHGWTIGVLTGSSAGSQFYLEWSGGGSG